MRSFAVSAFLSITCFLTACQAQHDAAEKAPVQKAKVLDSLHANDTALFLAGMPGRAESQYKALEADPAWQEHSKNMEALWDKFEAGRQPAMQKFAQSELAQSAQRTVWYPFSGADALTMLTFFPNRTTYVMAALEPPGLVPEPAQFTTETLGTMLPGIAGTLQSLLQKSFFVTKEMDQQLRGQVTDGVTEPILILLARSGYQINGFEYVQIDEQGKLEHRVPGPKRSAFGLNRGIRFDIEAVQGGRKASLYYISLNLDDAHMKNNPAFRRYITSLGQTDTLLKATSYMLHSENFNLIRSLILDASGTILQDDSGIPWKYFAAGPWQVQLYGDYVQPYGKSFQFRTQPDLRDAYASHKDTVKPLGFRIGYGAGKVPSNLQVARRRS
ncbi:MAG: hypothetical protein HY821_09705 [Acidobacteria bacterium]|nr:hypothetical protein [Acidobacteriota bacterium]